MQIHSEPHNTSYFKTGLWWKILISVIVFLGLGSLSGVSSMSEIQGWYANLNKPSFTPPNWLFGPVWSLLYILIGGSFGLIWQVAAKGRYPIITKFAKQGLVLFGIHFLLNLAWTPVFFGLNNPAWGLVIILALLTMIILLIRHFFRLDRLSAFLMIPYLIWVSYATALNIGILILN
jgi:tryptophan-rich sensory protein